VLHVRVVEAANHVDDRVHLPNVGEELVPQPFSLARSLHQSGDIQELDRRGDRLLRLHDVGEGIQARIGDGDDPGVRFNGCERIVRHQGTRTGQGVEEGGFANVRQADDSEAKHDCEYRIEDVAVWRTEN